MKELVLVGNAELLGRMTTLVLAERVCSADVIAHLAEIDRRRIFLDAACSSLSSYCMERLGYSEDEAAVRVRVARVAIRVPRVVEELREGGIHLSGLGLLAQYLTPENAEELLADARGQTKRRIEELIARRFPKPDIPPRVTREAEQLAAPGISSAAASITTKGTGEATRSRPGTNLAAEKTGVGRVQPISALRWSVQFTVSEQVQQKLERAKELLSHAIPDGDLASLFERALDALIGQETKRRFGAGRPRKRRETATDSRHIPVEVAREVWKRDGGQCTFIDAEGHRCSARRFVTYEHLKPFALDGASTPDNLCLRCRAHNLHAARAVFGAETIDAKCAERRKARNCARQQTQSEQIQPEQTGQTPRRDARNTIAPSAGVHVKAHAALCGMGLRAAQVRGALGAVREQGPDWDLEATLRAALALLVAWSKSS